MTPDEFNSWRIAPRIFLAGYGYILYLSSMWFMRLSDPVGYQFSFISMLWAANAIFFKFYLGKGKPKEEFTDV